MDKLRHIWTLMAAALLLWGCSAEIDPYSDRDEEIDDVELCFNLPAGPQTKSSIVTQDDDQVKEMMILVYRRSTSGSSNGTLVATRKCGPAGGVIHISNVSSRRYLYSFYAIANYGESGFDDNIPNKENDLKASRLAVSSYSALDGYVPMAWSLENQTLASSSQGTRYTIQFKRLMSRVDFSLDKSALGGVTIKSVRLRQGAADITPFTSGSAATSVIDSDYASDEDLAAVNNGGKATFYTLENMRGTLLPGNTDYWNKIPSSISDSEAALCTYLEVRAEFDDNAAHHGAVTYRLYLGKNSTTNFDVVRNTVSSIKITLTEDGLSSKVGWKVDTSELSKGIDWHISRGDLYIAQKATLAFTGVTISSIRTSGNGVLSLSGSGLDYELSALAEGTDTIFVKGISDENEIVDQTITLDVAAPVLGFEDSDLYLALDGTSKTIQPHYHDLDGNLLEDFDSELYAQLLAVTFNSDIVSPNVSCSYGESLTAHIHSLEDIESTGTGDIETKLALGTVSASAISPDIVPVTASVYTCDPFPASASLGSYESRGLLSESDADEMIYLNFSGIREFTDSTAYHAVLGTKAAPLSSRAISSLDGTHLRMNWLYGTNNDLYIPSGNETFSAYVTNSYSGESWWSPRTWTASFDVHVAIGGNAVYAGGSETNPMCWYVRAVWSHTHNENSPLQAVQNNIVASNEAFHGYYSTGMYTLLYSLDYTTGYPSSDAWYTSHVPEFAIVDITGSNYLTPVYVATPYSITVSGYNLTVHNLSDIRPSSNNWVK